MKISKTVEYGLAAIVYVAQNCKDGRVMSKRIGEEYDFPKEYVQQIMKKLVRAGIMTSKNGVRGGSGLAREATEITLLEIIEAIEGPVVVPMTFAKETGKPFAYKVEKIFLDVSEAMKASYSKVTLADLAE
jgi:Rrf2 family cysteine metabolism transcriptional repressor